MGYKPSRFCLAVDIFPGELTCDAFISEFNDYIPIIVSRNSKRSVERSSSELDPRFLAFVISNGPNWEKCRARYFAVNGWV